MSSDPEFETFLVNHALAAAEEGRAKLEAASGLIGRFTELAAAKGITLCPSSFEYIQTIGIVAKSPGLARALLMPTQVQRDGLIAYEEIVSKLAPSEAGYFRGDDYMLMAHPCYRRRMSPDANWAPRFIELLCDFNSPGVAKYIAIDDDRVRVNVDESFYMESDTWYGPPFNDDIRTIQPGLSKLRPPLDLSQSYIEFFFADTYCLDIKWSESGGIKTFQALEMKTENLKTIIDGREFFPARYLHAEFDVAQNHFRHFDGAVQYFLEEEYFRRRESDFNMPQKDSQHVKPLSEKVFKLNGPLAADDWVELCCQFFAANPLTFEYFTGACPKYVTEALQRIRARDASSGSA